MRSNSLRRPFHLLAVAALASASLLACSSKKSKCEKIVNEAAQLVESFGKAFGQKDAKMSDAEKKEALEKCMATPDDELDCAMNPNSKEPKCVELEKKKAQVDWETATVDEGKTKAQVPKGWKHENFMGDSYSPEKGFGTSYRISHTCGGMCESKPAADWEKVIGEEIERFKDASEKVVKDEKPNPTARVIVKDTMGDAKDVEVTLWHEGASFYVKCNAHLDKMYASQVDAFEKACLASEVNWGGEKK